LLDSISSDSMKLDFDDNDMARLRVHEQVNPAVIGFHLPFHRSYGMADQTWFVGKKPL